MRPPTIVPTITQRVRLFLSEQGAALRPWTGLQETYDELYALLRRRRSDPGFWQPLKVLLQEVVDSAAESQRRGPCASKAVELLDSWQVGELVDELRDALPADGNGAWPTRTDFTRMLSSAVLGGFLLLGLAAAGCGGDSKAGGPNPSGGTVGSGGHVTMVGGAGGYGAGGAGGTAGAGGTGLGGAGGTGAGGAGGTGSGGASGADGAMVDSRDDAADGTVLDSDAGKIDGALLDSGGGEVSAFDGPAAVCTQAVDPNLDRAIGDSTLGASQKSQLCQCFAALSTGWTTSLTQLFATATPEEISKMLSGLTPCCSSSGISTRSGSSPSSQDLSNIKSGSGYMMCAVPVYKGVSFPD